MHSWDSGYKGKNCKAISTKVKKMHELVLDGGKNEIIMFSDGYQRD